MEKPPPSHKIFLLFWFFFVFFSNVFSAPCPIDPRGLAARLALPASSKASYFSQPRHGNLPQDNFGQRLWCFPANLYHLIPKGIDSLFLTLLLPAGAAQSSAPPLRNPPSTAGAATALQTRQPDPSIVWQGIKTARPALASDLGTETRLSPARAWAIKRFAAQQPGQVRCLPTRRRQSPEGRGAGFGLLPARAHGGGHLPMLTDLPHQRCGLATSLRHRGATRSLPLLIPMAPCKPLGGMSGSRRDWMHSRGTAGAQMEWDRGAMVW